MRKLKKLLEKVGELYLTAVIIIIFFGGTFGIAVWVVKWIIKLLGGM